MYNKEKRIALYWYFWTVLVCIYFIFAHSFCVFYLLSFNFDTSWNRISGSIILSFSFQFSLWNERSILLNFMLFIEWSVRISLDCEYWMKMWFKQKCNLQFFIEFSYSRETMKILLLYVNDHAKLRLLDFIDFNDNFSLLVDCHFIRKKKIFNFYWRP